MSSSTHLQANGTLRIASTKFEGRLLNCDPLSSSIQMKSTIARINL